MRVTKVMDATGIHSFFEVSNRFTFLHLKFMCKKVIMIQRALKKYDMV